MTDSILADNRPITATLRLIGGPFEEVFRMSYFLTEAGHERSVCQQYVDDHVYRAAIDFLCRKAPNGRVDMRDDSVTGAKQIIIDDGLMRCIYEMSEQAQRQAETGVYPYTFLRSEPSRPLAAQSSPYATYNLRDWYHFPSSPPPLGDGTVYRCEEVPLTVGPVHIDGRDVSFQVHPYPERIVQHEVPTTYCFDCGQMVPITDTWTKKHDPNYALCEACFRVAEGAGRAKEGMIL